MYDVLESTLLEQRLEFPRSVHSLQIVEANVEAQRHRFLTVSKTVSDWTFMFWLALQVAYVAERLWLQLG